MKKAISLLLALVMCLSLCACGSGNDTPETTEAPTETTAPEETVMSKEEMLSIATNHYSYPLSAEISENIAKANATYLNQTVSIMGVSISEINLDHVVVKQGYTQYNIYLPSEELAELNKGDYVRVVGTITKFDTFSESQEGMTWDMVSVDMKPAHIVDKHFELENGLFSYIQTDENGKKYCFLFGPKLVDNYGNYIVYFSDEDIQRIEELRETQLGISINLHGNLIGITWEDKYGQCMLIEDAVIVSLE